MTLKWMLFIVLVFSSTLVSLSINDIVNDPYMDEPFHIPQAQIYCQVATGHRPLLHAFNWDPKITTPPGLYFITDLMLLSVHYLYHFLYNLAPSLVEMLHSWLRLNGEPCSVFQLRFANMILSWMSYWIMQRILFIVQPGEWATWTAFTLSLLPIHWFFQFLYYTDTGSVVFVLAALYNGLKGKPKMSAFLCLVAIFFRQTNIVWAGFIAVVSLQRALIHEACLREEKMAAQLALTLNSEAKRSHAEWRAMVKMLTCPAAYLPGVRECFTTLPFSWLIVTLRHQKIMWKMIWPFILLFISFVAFLVWNNGIVLGDRSNHQAVLHWPQIGYFSLFSIAFGWPCVAYESVWLFIQSFQRPTRAHLRYLAFTVFCIALMSQFVRHFTIVHPFLLADNRHFVFYLWRRLLAPFKWGLVPIYVICLQLLFWTLAQRNNLIFCVAWLGATVLTIVPSPLIEPRYYVIPFIIWRLHSQPQSRIGFRLLLEAIFFILINSVTLYLFLYRPYQWPQQSAWQRFMW